MYIFNTYVKISFSNDLDFQSSIKLSILRYQKIVWVGRLGVMIALWKRLQIGIRGCFRDCGYPGALRDDAGLAIVV